MIECFAEIEGPMWDHNEGRERHHVHITGWMTFYGASPAEMALALARASNLAWAIDGRVKVTLEAMGGTMGEVWLVAPMPHGTEHLAPE